MQAARAEHGQGAPLRSKRIFRFLALTFAIDWSLAGLYAAAGGTWNSRAAMVVASVYMLVPAVVAVLVHGRGARPPVASALWIAFRPNRWFAVAWLLPPVLAMATAGVGLLFPGVTYAPGMEGMFARFEHLLTPEQMAEMKAQMASAPVHVFWLGLLQGLVAGITINAAFGFGEELGWRGFLQRELAPLGFWRASVLIGVIWGIWHAPLILQGHNYPAHPGIGVLMMTGWTVLLAPLFAYITLRARSVIAASILHGTLNATVGLAIMLLRGGSDLTVGMTGAAGFVVLAAANLALYALTRGALDRQWRAAYQSTSTSSTPL